MQTPEIGAIVRIKEKVLLNDGGFRQPRRAGVAQATGDILPTMDTLGKSLIGCAGEVIAIMPTYPGQRCVRIKIVDVFGCLNYVNVTPEEWEYVE